MKGLSVGTVNQFNRTSSSITSNPNIDLVHQYKIQLGVISLSLDLYPVSRNVFDVFF